MSEIILRVENLVKSFHKKEVLKGINLDIQSGEIYGIIGASGSGKTTLLNSLIGFLTPTDGQVLFKNPHLLHYDGKDKQIFRNVLTSNDEVKKNFGFAAQDPSVYGKLTLVENLDLFGALYNMSKDARKTNSTILLKLMGLYESRNVSAESLSGGMLKRLDIACALIHDPKILILDEPTADLDPYLRRQMWYLIRKINSKGTTIVLSSHFLDELEELCDRIGIIHKGTMATQGTPAQIKKHYLQGEEVHLTTTYNRYDIIQEKLAPQKKKLGILDMRDVKAELIIKTVKPLMVVQEVAKITTKIEDHILDLRMNRPSMNEIFAEMIKIADKQIEKGLVKEPPKKSPKRIQKKKFQLKNHLKTYKKHPRKESKLHLKK